MNSTDIENVIFYIRSKGPFDVTVYSAMVREFGWDLAFLGTQAAFNDNRALAVDKEYSDYIMGL